MKMSRGMDLTPSAASDAGQPTVEVPGGQREKASGRERIRHFLKIKIRSRQMFDGVPKANKVRLKAKLMGQKVRVSCL